MGSGALGKLSEAVLFCMCVCACAVACGKGCDHCRRSTLEGLKYLQLSSLAAPRSFRRQVIFDFVLLSIKTYVTSILLPTIRVQKVSATFLILPEGNVTLV